MSISAPITNKTISTTNIKRLVVSGDEYDVIRFTVAKAYDGTDLSGADWYLQFTLNKEVGDLLTLTPQVSGDNLTLDWTPSEWATAYSGVLEFNLYAKIDGVRKYQTKIAKIYVEQTVDVIATGEFTPSVLEQYLDLFEAIKDETEGYRDEAEGFKDAAEASASAASSLASAAASSASAASDSATAAGNAQTAAEAAAAEASATYLDFDKRYLGAKASDPTLDNDGNALQTGALYFNTTSNVMKVYNGASWVVATADAINVAYDNSSSGLDATNVQEAIDELSDEKAEESDLYDTQEQILRNKIKTDQRVENLENALLESSGTELSDPTPKTARVSVVGDADEVADERDVVAGVAKAGIDGATLTNGTLDSGFEDGVSNWTPVSGSGIVQSSDYAKEGDYSGRMVATGTNESAYQDVEYPDGHEIAIIAWQKVTAYTAGNFAVGVWGYGAFSTFLGETTALNAVTDWTRRIKRVSAQDGGVRVYPILQGTPNMTAYIDAIVTVDLTLHNLTGLTDDEVMERIPYFIGTVNTLPQRLRLTNRNIAKLAVGRTTYNGITIEVDSDGLITINGTASAEARISLIEEIVGAVSGNAMVALGFKQLLLNGEGHAIKIHVVGGTASGGTYNISVLNESGSVIVQPTSGDVDKTFTASDDYAYALYFLAQSGMVFTDLQIKLQLELGSDFTDWVSPAETTSYTKEAKSITADVADRFDGDNFIQNTSDGVAITSGTSVNTTNYPLAEDGSTFRIALDAGGEEYGTVGTDSASGDGTLYYKLATPSITSYPMSQQATEEGGLLIQEPFRHYSFRVSSDAITCDYKIDPEKGIDALYALIDGEVVEVDESDYTVGSDQVTVTFTADLFDDGAVIWLDAYLDERYSSVGTTRYRLPIASTTSKLEVLLTALAGGTTGQVLAKNSDDDYDFTWITP